MTNVAVWYDETGRVKCVESADSKAVLSEHSRAEADTDTVGEITLDHVVTVSDGVVVSADYQPKLPTPQEIKQRLKTRLAQVAENKRQLAMLEDRQERIVAHILRITDIEIKVFKGILQQIGRNPVAAGDITQGEFDYMSAVQQRAQTVRDAFQAENTIAAEIEDGTIADPDYDIDGDPRWPA